MSGFNFDMFTDGLSMDIGMGGTVFILILIAITVVAITRQTKQIKILLLPIAATYYILGLRVHPVILAVLGVVYVISIVGAHEIGNTMSSIGSTVREFTRKREYVAKERHKEAVWGAMQAADHARWAKEEAHAEAVWGTMQAADHARGAKEEAHAEAVWGTTQAAQHAKWQIEKNKENEAITANSVLNAAQLARARRNEEVFGSYIGIDGIKEGGPSKKQRAILRNNYKAREEALQRISQKEYPLISNLGQQIKRKSARKYEGIKKSKSFNIKDKSNSWMGFIPPDAPIAKTTGRAMGGGNRYVSPIEANRIIKRAKEAMERRKKRGLD